MDNNIAYSTKDKLLLAGSEIRVLEPQREGEGRDSYVTYKVSVEGNSVRRRYSDFDSFREALVKLHPTCIVPPLPEKQSFAVAQLSLQASIVALQPESVKPMDDADLIEGRRRLLESFLRRVAKHPILSASHLFHKFLEAENWPSVLVENPLPSSSSFPLKTLTSLTDKVHHPDPRFLDIQNYSHKFNQQSAAIDRNCKKLVRREKELAGDFADYASLLSQLAEDEKELTELLTRTGDAVNNTFLSLRFMAMEIEEQLSDPLHEYALYGSSIKTVLKYHEQLQIQLEAAQHHLDVETEKLAKLEKTGNDGSLMGMVSKMFDSNPSQTAAMNIEKSKAAITTARTELDSTNATYTKQAEAIFHDWALFNNEKEKDYVSLLLQYSNIQVDFYKRNQEAWEKCLRRIDEM